MNSLRAIAEAHYREGSESTKEYANRFFHGMRKDRDGKVDYVEFKRYLTSKGHDYYAKRDLFNRLASNGVLGFWDVMTLFYIIVSKRPFFKKCDKFLVGDYFACVSCFQGSTGPYRICIRCYTRPATDFRHASCDRPNFLDNCTMLARTRLPPPQPRIEHRHTDQRSQAIVQLPAQHSRHRSTSQPSQAIVQSPAQHSRHRSSSQPTQAIVQLSAQHSRHRSTPESSQPIVQSRAQHSHHQNSSQSAQPAITRNITDTAQQPREGTGRVRISIRI